MINGSIKSRLAADGGTPVRRLCSAVALARAAASAFAGGDASDDITARAHNAPAAEARASAPSSLIGVFVSIALVYSQHDCDAREVNYTVALSTSRMSQANDVAKGRHFLYYLVRNIPHAAKCEPVHGTRAAEGIPIVLRTS
jgi:hypothetical protein